MERSRLVRTLLIALGVVGVLTIAAGIFVVSLLRQDMSKVELSFRLEPGKSYAFHCEEISEFTEETEGKEVDHAATLIVDHTFDVQEVDADGNAKIKATCDRVQVKQSGPDGEVDYDSSATSEVPAACKAQVELLAQDFSMTLSPKGRILAMEVPEPEATEDLSEEPAELAEMLAAELAEFREKMQADLMAEQKKMRAMVLQMRLEGLLAIYPEGAVGPGDSWQRRIGPAEIRDQGEPDSFSFKRHKRGLAIITLRAEAEQETHLPGKMGIRANVSVSAKGTFEVDKATGCVRSSEVRQKIGAMTEHQGLRTDVRADSVVRARLLPKE